MKLIRIYYLSIALFIVTRGVFLFPEPAWAETGEEWVAKVISMQGNVQAKRKDKTQWEPVQLNDIYYPGDTIRVQEWSRAGIALSNETVIRLDQNTTITFTGIEKQQTPLLDMLTGAIHFITRTPRILKVHTPFVDATVKGTEFLVEIREDQTLLTVFEGQVSATNGDGTLLLASGQSAIAKVGQAPAPYVRVRPRDAVQWALYYPPIISFRAEDFPATGKEDWQSMVRESIQYYWKGYLTRAFSSIEKVPKDIRDPRFFNYRAALLLSVGRVDEASLDIEKTLNLAPGNSHAIALQSIVAIVQNEREKGLGLAQKAVETDPDSAASRIALSYAHQANFNLEGAFASLQEAVRRDPQNGLAWARLSELWLSFGKLDESLESAQKAVALNPDLARTHIVLGFAYLTQIKVREAVKSFEKAVERDQANPLARLGLGLAKIRGGKLKEGRREIEIAASLDPNQSIIRSYLGKAYFDEKRDKLAKDQFIMAKEIDPLDPTPLFYDAIRKQTQNRPVEALQDLQKSIELNNNRATYRSSLLLDSDLAARSSSLARIYTDLGYQELALVEGWKSVNLDPSDFSAHRFLADTYSALPRHEIARVSELLQSQLLQPINITPIQPQLAESNLFILEGAGPQNQSFNEFNPLFNRNRLTLQADSVAGGNGTFGEEIVQSGIIDKLSYSIGQFHYKTNGFRENNDLKNDIDNVFAQLSLSNKTSVQAEFRYFDREKGDLLLRFFPENNNTTIRENERTETARFGFHHAFTPNSEIIASSIFRTEDFKQKDIISLPDINIGSTTELKSYSNEIQHLFRTGQFSIISGVGYFKASGHDKEVDTFENPPDILEIKRHTVLTHKNLYVYSQLNYLENMTITLGGSADSYDDGDIARDQFNPKVGLTWNFLPSTTFRTALFRTLKRSLIANQTIEPTQVAGFNQFFDDPTGTAAWRYGAALDQKFSKSLYGGVEYSRRELDVPILSGDPVIIEHKDWRERLARSYLYWTPHPWLATSAEFRYERFSRDGIGGVEAFNRVGTYRLPLGLNFFHPSGFNANLLATFVDQAGEFGFMDFVHGKDQFWIFDTSVGYRLPKRWGFVSAGVKNLFNEKFNFQDTDPATPTIIPERLFLARFTLSF
ncbi:MAG TPA: FecR domain-containing protein [Candidatus Brocadiaceae bacterium]